MTYTQRKPAGAHTHPKLPTNPGRSTAIYAAPAGIATVQLNREGGEGGQRRQLHRTTRRQPAAEP